MPIGYFQEGVFTVLRFLYGTAKIVDIQQYLNPVNTTYHGKKNPLLRNVQIVNLKNSLEKPEYLIHGLILATVNFTFWDICGTKNFSIRTSRVALGRKVKK